MNLSNQDKTSGIYNTPERFSSLSQKILLAIKASEYFFIAAFICAGVFTFVFPENKAFIVYGTVSLALFIFFFLLDRQFFGDAGNPVNQYETTKKAVLYKYLISIDNTSGNDPIVPAREKAIRYCQELIDDYKKTRGLARTIYYVLQLATIVFSGVTPILVLADKIETSQTWLKWLPVICPAIASIVASVVTSFPFQENWISANKIVELLEAEQEKFILGVTQSYRCYDIADESQRQQKAKMAIENFLNQVNSIHLQQVQEADKLQLKEEKTEATKSTS